MQQTVEEDELEDDVLSAEDLQALRNKINPAAVPVARGWSTPTFACHRHVSSCVLACCCPCVQFGLNQRAAFGASCIKWAVLWVLPLILLYVCIDNLAPPTVEGKAGTADQLVIHVKERVRHHVKKAHGMVLVPSPPPPPPPPLDHPIDGPTRSALFMYAYPVAPALVGLVGAMRRQKLRMKYGIGGSSLGDFMSHACCMCCSISKEAREIKHQAIEEALANADADLNDE